MSQQRHQQQLLPASPADHCQGHTVASDGRPQRRRPQPCGATAQVACGSTSTRGIPLWCPPSTVPCKTISAFFAPRRCSQGCCNHCLVCGAGHSAFASGSQTGVRDPDLPLLPIDPLVGHFWQLVLAHQLHLRRLLNLLDCLQSTRGTALPTQWPPWAGRAQNAPISELQAPGRSGLFASCPAIR